MYKTNTDIFDNYQEMKENRNLLIKNLRKQENSKRRYRSLSN